MRQRRAHDQAAMLDAAVRSLKEGKEPDLNAPLGVTTEINLHVSALLLKFPLTCNL